MIDDELIERLGLDMKAELEKADVKISLCICSRPVIGVQVRETHEEIADGETVIVTYFIICESCKRIGKESPNLKQAILLWNKYMRSVEPEEQSSEN